MRTTQPSVTIGSYTWAQDRLPYDEFTLRLDDARAAMDRNGYAALLAYGDVREHAALAYFSNFIPRVRWGLALLPRNGEPRLLGAMSTRDLPAMRTLTWIVDVQSGMGPEWVKAFDPWIEKLKGEQVVTLGTVGFDIMAPVLLDAVRRSLGARFALQRADDALAIPSPHKRPREATMMRAAGQAVEAAAKVFIESWRANRTPETAALDAERFARSHAAQDVRTLVSLDGGRTLVPFQGRFETRAGPLVGYLAVKLAGYWADMFITVADAGATPAARAATAALDALIADVRPGVSADALHAKALAALGPNELHPALGGSVGHSIGLSLHEGAEFTASADTTLVEDGIYALQVGAADSALLSAIIRCTAKGTEVLARSPSQRPGG